MFKITKYKNIKLALALASLGALIGISLPATTYAVNYIDCPDGTSVALPPDKTINQVCQGHMTAPTTNKSGDINLGDPTVNHQCGSKDGAVKTSINFGCKGESCLTNHPTAYCSGNNSGILDLAFAIIRFLSYGVGLIVIGSMVVAGIQYTSSQGDPKATAAAETRIKATVIALLIYIFGYAILNYILPKGFLK